MPKGKKEGLTDWTQSAGISLRLCCEFCIIWVDLHVLGEALAHLMNKWVKVSFLFY